MSIIDDYMKTVRRIVAPAREYIVEAARQRLLQQKVYNLALDSEYTALEQLMQTSTLTGNIVDKSAFLSNAVGNSSSSGFARGTSLGSRGGSVSMPTGSGELTPEEHKQIQDACYNIYYRTPYGRVIIETLKNYILGESGFVVDPDDEAPEVAQYWDAFAESEFFAEIQDEMVVRKFREGETFMRFYPDLANKRLAMRMLEPQWVADSTGKWPWGIETAPGDLRRVINYFYEPGGEALGQITIPAEYMIHRKMFSDSQDLRGRPLMEPIVPKVVQYDDWQFNRLVLSRIRNAVALVKKISGRPSQVTAIRDANKAYTDGTNQYRQETLQPGTVFTSSAGVDYEMLSPNLQAQDAQHDGRMILLGVAAGVGMPEFMVTMDASNANYSSTLVSEGPAIKMFQSWRRQFASDVMSLFRYVIRFGIKVGAIPGKSKNTIIYYEDGQQKNKELPTETSTKCTVQYSQIHPSSMLDDTEARRQHREMGLVSKRTLQNIYDYDPEQEDYYMQKEDAGAEPDDYTEERDAEIARSKFSKGKAR